MNKFFEKLPFKAMAEKIPAEKREKYPILGKAIPFANQIACGFAAVLLVVVIVACSGKGGSGGGGSGGGGSVSAGGGTVTVGGVKVNVGRAAPSSDFTYSLYTLDDVQGVRIEKYTGDGGAVVIPAEIEGYPVLRLGNNAFYGEDRDSYGPGQNITSVVIPASVKEIGGGCFSRIENLTSVTILGSGVIVNGIAFISNLNMTELNFPDGDNVLIPYVDDEKIAWGADAFVGCKKLPLAVRAKLVAMGFDEP